MSNKLMDTSPGGENTQYESIATYTKPHDKEAGQLGDSATSSSTSTSQPVDSSRATKTAENIRYGQAKSEQGIGGQTSSDVNDGEENVDAGFGGTASNEGDESVGSGMRDVQGYGGEKDMRKDVGA